MVHIYRQKNDIKAEEFTGNMAWTDVYRVEYYYYIPVFSVGVWHYRIER